MRFFLTNFLTIFLLLLALPGPARCGSVTGLVLGEGENPEARFRVEIQNEATGETFETTTDEQGAFEFGGLAPGEYLLLSDIGSSEPVRFTVSEAGLTMARLHSAAGGGSPTSTPVEIRVVTTTPEQVSEIFPHGVVDEAVQPDWIDRSGAIYGAYNLSLLAEAIRPPLEFSPFSGPAVAGRPADANSFAISGVDNNNRAVPGPLLYLPDAATEEFTLQQNASNGKSGHVTGGYFNSVARRGSNMWHGSAYWFLQNRILNSRDARLSNFNLADKPRYDQNRLGGSLSMPILADKLFGSFSFEYLPFGFESYGSSQALAPTQQGLQMLRGNPNVSQRNLDLLANNVRTFRAVDQTEMVGGAAIPLGLVSSGVSGSRNTYAGVGVLDFVATDHDRLNAHYVQNDINSSFSGGALPSFATPSDTQSILASIGYTHAGSTYVNELRLGYNRLDSSYNPGTFALDGAQEGSMPFISIQGSNLPLGARYPFTSGIFNTYHLSDQMSLTLGRHQIQFGGDARKVASTQLGFPQFNGAYTYSSLGRFLLDQTPDVFAQRAFGSPALNANQWIVNGWLLDRIRVMSKLTVEAGLHYQWAQLPEFARRQRLNSFDLGQSSDFSNPDDDNQGFGPRLGVAYAPTTHFIMRAGGGVEYDTLYLANRLGRTLGPQSGLVTQSNPASVASGFLANGGVQRPGAEQGRLGAFFTNQQLPYTIHWNGGFQGSLWGNFTGSIRYVGNRSLNQPRFSQLNPNGFVTATRNLPVYFNSPSLSEINNLSLSLNDIQNVQPGPWQQAGFTNPLYGFQPAGTSWYHAGIVELNRRMTRGVQMSARYTLSDLQIDSYGNGLDLGFQRAGHFNAPYNPDHRVTVSGVLDLDDMFPDGGIVTDIIANLSVMGTYTYMSHISAPLVSSLDTSLSGAGMSAAIFENPDGTPGVSSGVDPIRNNLGQIVAYQATNPNARYVRGGLGSYSTGQSYIGLNPVQNFDVAASKKFTFMERTTFELRAEAYNVLNHRQITGVGLHGFLPPNLLGSSTPSQLVPGSSNFGNLGSLYSSNPRRLQFALRVTF
ncbi:MAG: hypothetical protein GC160_21670 [Acidobacteria bacterium]|nr:hypothetical protein [Acidobacteriota bacterium]